MSFNSPVVPLDASVWNRWIANNRKQEQVHFARLLRVAVFLSPLALAAAVIWFLVR